VTQAETAAFIVALVLAACDGGSNGSSPSKSGTKATCEKLCAASERLHCPDDTGSCMDLCTALYDNAKCTKEVRASLDCQAAQPASAWQCNDEGRAGAGLGECADDLAKAQACLHMNEDVDTSGGEDAGSRASHAVGVRDDAGADVPAADAGRDASSTAGGNYGDPCESSDACNMGLTCVNLQCTAACASDPQCMKLSATSRCIGGRCADVCIDMRDCRAGYACVMTVSGNTCMPNAN
jgi:hypothetical protein